MTVVQFFKEAYDSIPFFTRYWMTASLVLSTLGRFGIAGFPITMLLPDKLLEFEIWRPITAALDYSHTFEYLVALFMLYQYNSRLETDVFAGKPAEYVWLMFFGWVSCTVLALALGLWLTMDCMVAMMIYVWSLFYKDTMVQFLFGLRFKAMYLPWALLLFHFIVKDPMADLIGIAVGHLAHFLIFRYPQEFGGPSLLTPPDFVRRIFPDYRVRGGLSYRSAPRAPPAAAAGGYQWGRGHVLGGN